MTKSRAAFKAENYGEVLAVVNDLELVSYEEDGGYQGEYMAILTDGERLFYFFDSYGSCSGCDWLLDEQDYDDKPIEYARAKEYCEDIEPKYIVPKDQPLEFIGEEGDGWKLKKVKS